jgi:SH3 domain protein
MGRRCGLLLGFVAAAGFGLAVQAQTVRYVTDSLRLEARSGPSTSHKILQMLPSGTPVTVLEETDGYNRVRTPEGNEVWILSRYLESTPAAQDRLAEALAELERYRAEKTQLVSSLKETRGAAEEVDAALRTAQSESQELRQELTRIRQAAASALATRAENERLTGTVSTLREQLDTANSEVRFLKEGRERDWFIAGAAVLGVGIVLGLILPRLGRRRRRNWSGDF